MKTTPIPKYLTIITYSFTFLMTFHSLVIGQNNCHKYSTFDTEGIKQKLKFQKRTWGNTQYAVEYWEGLYNKLASGQSARLTLVSAQVGSFKGNGLDHFIRVPASGYPAKAIVHYDNSRLLEKKHYRLECIFDKNPSSLPNHVLKIASDVAIKEAVLFTENMQVYGEIALTRDCKKAYIPIEVDLDANFSQTGLLEEIVIRFTSSASVSSAPYEIYNYDANGKANLLASGKATISGNYHDVIIKVKRGEIRGIVAIKLMLHQKILDGKDVMIKEETFTFCF